MNADDPKFTAHALGELADLTPAERAEIEALLASDPTAAAEAAETQALAARLRAELSGEAAGALQEEQRAAVFQAAKMPVATEKKVVRFPRRTTVLAAIAACLIVGISYALLFRAYDSEHAPKSTAAEPITLTVTTDVPAVPPPDQPATSTPQAITPDEKLAKLLADSPKVATGQPVAMPMSEARLAMPAATPASIGLATDTANSEAKFTLSSTAPVARPVAAVPVVTQRFGGSTVSMSRPDLAQYTFDTGTESTGDKVVVPRKPAGALFKNYSSDPQNPPRESESNTADFGAIAENDFLRTRENPLSTFSIDVDTASYAIVRRFLDSNRRPPKGAVRIEELLNYFTYDYPQPKGDVPFSATMEVAACPWAPEHRLVRIGLKGREISKDQRPPSNLVFLIDVSGSMFMPNKLPLVKESLGLLIDQLRDQDQVAIVVYAGNTGCVLEPTHDRAKMREVLGQLEAGGSTNGASGIQLAYQLAEKSFIQGGTNRVILATDGDWNVGITNHSDLLDMIAQKAKSGVFLTVLGFGMDNLKDSMLMKLADRGNGNYAYIDTLIEAKKVFVEQLSSTLVTIAKDVKIQVEFNPAQVGAYRLIGYEKRMLAKEDFNNDQKDAGEIGAGHTVTALYEVVPAGQEQPQLAMVDKLKYQPQTIAAPAKDAAPAPAPAPSKAEEKAPASPVPATSASEPVAQAAVRPQSAVQAPEAEIKPAPIPHAIPVEKPISPKYPDAGVRQGPWISTATGEWVLADDTKKPIGPHKTIIIDTPASVRNELLTLKLRYKAPDGDKSKLLEFPLTDPGTTWEKSSPDFRFAAAVAGYGMLLRDSNYRGQVTWASVAEWAHEGLGPDVSGYRTEFLSLLEKAEAVAQ